MLKKVKFLLKKNETIVVLYRHALNFSWCLLGVPFRVFLYITHIKLPRVYTERIGHLAVEPDCFLKEALITTGKIPKALLLYNPRTVANKALAVDYWSDYFLIVKNSLLARFLKACLRCPRVGISVEEYAVAMKKTARCFGLNREWGNKPPLLKIKQKHIDLGMAVLRKMGLPDGAWYVCIHGREGGYSPTDEHVHSYRNTKIDQFMLAVDYVYSLGGYCVRLGDSSMQAAPQHPALIDYALSEFKSDWMDLFLGATCKFFLGSNSGAFELATLFGTPVAAVNMAPLTTSPRGINDLSIPMLYQDNLSGCVLPFREIMDSSLSKLRLTEDFVNNEIELVPNTPGDIRDLAEEMFVKISNGGVICAEDQAIQDKFESMLMPGHYCYGRASRTSARFLMKHSHLLN